MHKVLWLENLKVNNIPLGRHRRRWEDTIRMDLREMGWECVDWVHLAQDRTLLHGVS
jgi:hypothetical protein